MGYVSPGVSAALTKLTKTQHPRSSSRPRGLWSSLHSLGLLSRFTLSGFLFTVSGRTPAEPACRGRKAQGCPGC